MLAWKIAPALAAGNTVVLKPAEFTPLTALAFAEICVEAGLPPGVVNIVTGDGATGAALVAHDGVDKIAFTGSTEVGRAIRKATAGTGKKLSLELGGKSPFVVFEDADLDSAVEGVVDAIWFNQGQVCCAGSRLLVAEVDRRAAATPSCARGWRSCASAIRSTSRSTSAPIVAPVQLERIKRLVEQGEREGAKVWRAPGALPERGCFYPPTLVTERRAGVDRWRARRSSARCWSPMTFRTPDEAIALANNTRYGLAAWVWTENVNLALEVAARDQGRRRVDQFDQPVRRRLRLRRLPRERLRPRGRARGPGRIPRRRRARGQAERKAVAAPALTALPGRAPAPDADADRPHRQALHRRQAGAARLRLLLRRARPARAQRSGLAGLGNRKDIRNAVEAASEGVGWGAATAHNRAQVLYYVAENLEARAGEFAERLRRDDRRLGARRRARRSRPPSAAPSTTPASPTSTTARCMRRKTRFVTLAMNEPWGVMGIVCPDEAPLLGFVSLVMPAIAMGNCVVVVPSAAHPLSATDFYSVLDTSDVPAGVVNIVTGEAAALAKVARRARRRRRALVRRSRRGRQDGRSRLGRQPEGDLDAASAARLARGEQGREYLRRATQVKNIWTPYGE